MRPTTRWFSSIGLGLILAACGGDGAGPSGLVDITGTWHATKGTFTNISNPSESMDALAGGVTFVVVFGANKSFTVTITVPGTAPEVSSGTYAQTSQSLALTDAGDQTVTTFGLSISGNTMTLTHGVLDFDFGSGETPAYLDLTFQKQ